MVAKNDQKRPEMWCWHMINIQKSTKLTFDPKSKMYKGIEKIILKNDMSILYEPSKLDKLSYFKFDDEDQVCEFYEELEDINRKNSKFKISIKYISGLTVYCICTLKDRLGDLIDV